MKERTRATTAFLEQRFYHTEFLNDRVSALFLTVFSAMLEVKRMRVLVVAALNINIAVFCNVTPCSLVSGRHAASIYMEKSILPLG
jgi:hypothetical protein